MQHDRQRPELCEGWGFCVPVVRLAVNAFITAKLQKIIKIMSPQSLRRDSAVY